VAALTGVAIAMGSAAPARAAQDDAVYGLANGCYQVDGGGPYRFKAVTLGRFMLMAKDGRLLSRDGGTATPGQAADWTVDHLSGDRFTLKATYGAASRDVQIVPAGGCADFPEAEVNAEGPVYKGPTPYGETRGYIDAHMHMMAFHFLGGEIHCGEPWNAYGITQALKGCDRSELGSPVVESALSGGVEATSDPVGWPTFESWPRWNALTHEQSYYKWLERSWRGGQRLFVNLFVENHALCSLYPHKSPGYNCNEMDSVRRQAFELKNLQSYIDAQYGGPGKGWFRIVSDPFEARRVINAGKMAIVPGIEVSDLFDCGLRNGVSRCTAEDVDRRLNEAYNELGVRDMELINKFDNGFGGVAGDSTTTGVIVNLGNYTETGRWWDMKPCKGPSEESDHPQYGVPALLAPLAQALPPGTLPVYGPGPHCNTMGLTTLGEHLVRKMIEKRMLVDPDHLSVIARKQLLSIIESEDYSGVVSSHSWSTDDAYPRIYKRGGFVAPYAGSSQNFVREWKKLKVERDPRYYWGIGWGADMNGFGNQGPPRHGKDPVRYPFTSWDGKVTLDRQKTGVRTFDINTDGVAHYGLYPDWVEDLRMQAGDAIVNDLARGAEAYLQMWERAVGVAPSDTCRQARLRFTDAGQGEVKIATTAEEVLRGAGQPRSRGGRVWRYCVTGKAGGRVSVVYTKAGTSGLIVSTAPRHRVAGLGTGSRVARAGLHRRSAGRGRQYVYRVTAGKVRWVALVSSSVARNARELARELKLAGVR
jgi:hypothetical protein